MALPFPSMAFIPFAILTAAELNQFVSNDQALAAGTGLNNGAVTAQKIDFTTLLLADVRKTTDFATSTTTNPVQITGMTASVSLVSGYKYRISYTASNCYQTGSGGALETTLWNGAVVSGTQVTRNRMNSTVNVNSSPNIDTIYTAISTGVVTFNVGLRSGNGTATIEAAATYPSTFTITRIG